MEDPTHIPIFQGQANQIEAGTSFPTSRDVPEYKEGNKPQLEDGDVYYIKGNQILGVRVGGTWQMLQFATA